MGSPPVLAVYIASLMKSPEDEKVLVGRWMLLEGDFWKLLQGSRVGSLEASGIFRKFLEASRSF
jgi:hypothetical protein